MAPSNDSNALPLDGLIPLLYEQLREIARHRLRAAPNERSLNTTGLVHEAYLRLAASPTPPALSEDHLLALASRVMRNVLVDHARARVAQKRGTGAPIDLLADADAGQGLDLDGIMDLHEALERLEHIDARQAQIVELHYFGGLNIDETASALALSPATIKRELRIAKAWLSSALKGPHR